MKRIAYGTLAIAVISGGLIFSGCQSATEKQKTAEAKVADAKEELKSSKEEVLSEERYAANEQQWKIFRDEAREKIKANETRIAELKAKKSLPGKSLDALYERRIDTLEMRNKDLQRRIDDYPKTNSNWDTFKREFNHDMDGLGDALKDFVKNNSK